MATKRTEVKDGGTKQVPIVIRPIIRKAVTMRIAGTSALIQHQWSEKVKKGMLDKQQGIKVKMRAIRDPKKEGEEAAYRTVDGYYGIPLTALKKSVIGAAHKDVGLEKTLVRKALFIKCDDPGGVLKMECSEPVIREDMVRVGMGTADLRYRPYFHTWSVEVVWEIDAELLVVETLVTLVNRAGFGVGIGEWRPEKGGDNGRFKVDLTFPIKEEICKD